jgi:NAD(P)-dependent dehydrogenase (short-subunit alcohol dehydrogenase family)
MDLQVSEKVAFVTGSTAGIGYAIAERLALEGAGVIVNGRTSERVDNAIAAIRTVAPAARVYGFAADLGTADGAREAIQRFPQVNILVNNLGIFAAVPFEKTPDEDWIRFFEVNVLSGVRLSRGYAPRMKERNWGRIVFISSESALQIPAEMIHYGMTKTAQLAVARGIAESLVGTIFTVNSVIAGPTASEGVHGFVKQMSAAQNISKAAVEKQFFQTIRPTSLLRRFETPDEIAAVVAFIASPLSSGVNGSAIRVDGGVVRSIA